MRWTLAAVSAVALIGAACGGSNTAATPTPTADAPTSPPLTVEPVATETPAATPSPTPWDDYIEVVEGEPVPLPEGVVLYYYGYVFTEGIPADRWLRAVQTDGGLDIRDLSETLPDGSGAYFADGGYGLGQFSTSVCVQGYCGGIGPASSDARSEAFLSGDGGVTWTFEADGGRPEGVYVVGTRSDGVQVVSRYDDSTQTLGWFTWPGMEPIEPPAPGARAQMLGDRLVWATGDPGLPDFGGTTYDEDGNVIAAPVRLPPLPGSFTVIRGSTIDLAWWIPLPRDNDATVYISQVAPDGALLRTVRLERMDPALVGWIDEDRIVIRRWNYSPGGLADAAILNFATGEMNRIDGLQPTEQDRDAYVTGVVTGEFALVDAPGSCLHVRERADTTSQSLGCFADGVLFHVTGDPHETDGTEWLPVRAPGNIDGFASTEFLVR